MSKSKRFIEKFMFGKHIIDFYYLLMNFCLHKDISIRSVPYLLRFFADLIDDTIKRHDENEV